MYKGLFIVISGPSGVGKSTVISRIRERLPEIKKSVSVTTREPRKGEKNGVHYYFKTLLEYQQMIADGEFLETAEVYTNYYGTPKKPVFKELEKGNDIIGELDTYGAKQVKKSFPESVRIFLMPPDFTELKARLVNRGSEDESSLQRRIAAARRELKQFETYNYIVFNGEIEQAVDEIIGIINAEKRAVCRNRERIGKLLAEKE